MIRRCSSSIFLLLAVLLPGRLLAQVASPPAAASKSASASWVGKYADSRLEFELKQASFGGLTGVLIFESKSYVATARADGNKLTGTFRAGADSFPYEATRQGNELRFVTGGTEYVLQRHGDPPPAAPTNPLTRRSSGTPSTPSSSSAPGKAVEFNLGFSLRLPVGWTAKENAEGVMILPGGVDFDPNRNDNPEVYIAAVRNDYDPSEETEFVQQLSAAATASGGSGGQRHGVTFGKRSGSIHRWDVRDPQTGILGAFDLYIATESSRAFVMIAAGEKNRIRANEMSVRQMLSSAAVVTPKLDSGGPLADSTPLAQRWLNKLRGRVVRQFWASQGMSSDKRHWLYADGTYAFKSSSMVSVDVPGAGALSTGRDDSTGRWRVRDVSGEVFLEVRYNNGNMRRMPITEDNRNWYLNGEKAFAVDP